MSLELLDARKCVGLKQSLKAVKDGTAKKAFIAADAEERIVRPFRQACEEKGVEIAEVATMKELGHACGIDIGSAVAVILL